jgi:hypothetical protein
MNLFFLPVIEFVGHVTWFRRTVGCISLITTVLDTDKCVLVFNYASNHEDVCGVMALLHVILISERDSFHKAPLPRERSRHYQLIGGWVDTTTDLNILENKLISSPYLL